MPKRMMFALLALLVLCCVGYLTLGAKASWGFTLQLRGPKLLALLLIGASISTATVLLQSVTQNRILTPSIMGFDALYVLIFTGAVFFLGGFAVSDLPPTLSFVVSAGAMILVAMVLFGTLLIGSDVDLPRMILTGVILGTLFRSLTGFLQRLIDPNEFSVIQVGSYARFNDIDLDVLAISAVCTGIALMAAWRMRFRLDVLMLGRTTAINLGEPPKRASLQALLVIAVLVSVSTALVGPVAFLGLLVVSIAHILTPRPYHSAVLPIAALVSMITLVGGQTILERVFRLNTPLSVIIDVFGGIVFLGLLLKGIRR